jgi:hypothetical protein
MTGCHQPIGVRSLMSPMFQRGTSGVTGSKAVTDNEVVTQQTIAAQCKSSLSPVSPLRSLPLLLRAIGVWGCHLSPVTVVTGDKPSTALVSRTVANRLSQQVDGGGASSPKKFRKHRPHGFQNSQKAKIKFRRLIYGAR